MVALLFYNFLFLVKGKAFFNCKPTAMALHFFLLASFFWTSATAINVFLGFYNLWRNRMPPPILGRGMRRIHCWVIACCWGFPLGMTTFCVLLDLVFWPNSIGYGVIESCWIGKEFSRLVAFAIPSFISLFLNLFLAAASLTIMYVMRQKGLSHNFCFLCHQEMAIVAVRLFVSIGSQWFFGFLLYVLEDDVRSVKWHILVLASLVATSRLCLFKKSIFVNKLFFCL